MNKEEIRSLYKSVRLLQTHLAYSSVIATAAICKYRFRLRHILGASIPTYDDTPIGLAAHDVLSLSMLDPIINLWRNYDGNMMRLIDNLVGSIRPIKDEVLSEYETWYRSRDLPFPNDFKENLEGVLIDLLTHFAKKVMTKMPPPRKILTEITITNVKKQHEGRIDALLEFHNGSYLVIDWKTSPEPAHSYGYNHIQVLANALLANYRYHLDEDCFTGCRAAVVHCDGVLKPKIPPTQKILNTLKEARNYVLECLSGRAPHAQMPSYFQCSLCPDQQNCEFYRWDTLLDREGLLPQLYSNIRKLLFRRKMIVLEERANIHIHKFIVDHVFSANGEQGLKVLEEAKVIETGYRLKGIEENTLILEREDTPQAFEKRDIVRIVGREPNIPLFACINTKGIVQDISGSSIRIRVRNKVSAKVTFKQLINLPILLVRDNIDLTDLELRPLHFFQRLAALKLGRTFMVGHDEW